MKCPKCGNIRTGVYRSIAIKEAVLKKTGEPDMPGFVRDRTCECGYRFETIEMPLTNNFTMIQYTKLKDWAKRYKKAYLCSLVGNGVSKEMV